jgi:hypothetical protein
MDEIDAALDNVNVNKVSNYIRAMSRSDFQCIVISLKDKFYSKADSLIGVHRDTETNGSKTLSLRLTDFDDAEEEGDEERPESAAAKEVDVGSSLGDARRASGRGRKKKARHSIGRGKRVVDTADGGMTGEDGSDEDEERAWE